MQWEMTQRLQADHRSWRRRMRRRRGGRCGHVRRCKSMRAAVAALNVVAGRALLKASARADIGRLVHVRLSHADDVEVYEHGQAGGKENRIRRG